ncbi:YbaK/EbsC family protein [Microvirga lenta]|uniref:YbaK/EbsC family protein n=1 Tax=Microvirga lenta TaxID=2881337 RepID=UPI001CFCB37C|nr:YbaK/EbsC family protein [Microvirga lenta]MCB5173842.1 YbaK/EbsC family protein [Microvirga lenta]
MNAPLTSSSQRVQAAAERLGLSISILEMPQSTRTAEEAAAACGCDVAQIVKSLVFQGAGSGQPYLLLVSGKNRVDEEGVAGHIGEALLRPDAAQVRSWTGYAIGGIPPFGHAMPLRTLVDRDLLGHDIVWAAAGTPRAVFSTDPKALMQATGAEIIAVA